MLRLVHKAFNFTFATTTTDPVHKNFTILKDKYLIEKKPTRAIGPYSLFVKERFQEFKVSGPAKNTLTKLANIWNDLTEGEKKTYEEKAKAANVGH